MISNKLLLVDTVENKDEFLLLTKKNQCKKISVLMCQFSECAANQTLKH